MSRQFATSGSFLTAIAAVIACGFLYAQNQEPTPPDILAAMRNQQPAFLVRVDVNKQTRDYREGDYLSVRVASELDAYLYVLYQQADGRVDQIFPNRHQSDNYVRARQAVDIPARDDLFRWHIGAPFGKETLWVLAKKNAVKSLSDPALRQKRSNPVGTKHLKGVELELGEAPPEEWAVHSVDIHTYARDQSIVTPGSRRFAVFFGVSEYEFNAEYEEAQKKPDKPADQITPLNLPTSHRNARGLAEVLQEVAQFSDWKIYTNEQATKDEMRKAITEWLPSVSRPGDTVVIFYSGHGMQIPNDNDPERMDNEPDGKDEVINPHGQVTLAILDQLLKKEKLPADVASRATEWVRLVEAAAQGSRSDMEALERAESALVRATGVSDDEFGHWLQKLDSRQIAVILNGCHTGGLATNEKGNRTGAQEGRFDFLDTEVGRLKDIGQQGNCALFTACSSSQSSLVRPERDYSVMPYFLIEFLRSAKGPVEISKAYEFCRVKMEAYFEQHKEMPAHQPQFYPAGEPILLKP